jgi:MYND finger
VVYCSPQCQRADWEDRHRGVCDARRNTRQGKAFKDPETHLAINLHNQFLKHDIPSAIVCGHGISFFIQQTVCQSHWAKIILRTLSLSLTVVSRMDFRDIPFQLTLMARERYQPLFASSDKDFERDFLSWNPPRSLIHEGSRMHFTLVEGVFAFDGADIVVLVTLKLCIREPAAGSSNEVTTVCMDSISRIGCVPVPPHRGLMFAHKERRTVPPS